VEQWKKLTEPVAVLAVVGAVGTWAGAIDGVPGWVTLILGGIVVAVGAAARAVSTPLARPRDNEGRDLAPAP
jgi:hypothetical protein